MNNNDDDHTTIATLAVRMAHVERLVEQLVHRREFEPVKAIAFGLAGLALAALVGALVSQVFK